MNKDLELLSVYNKAQLSTHDLSFNGIACPKCKKELHDAANCAIPRSNPQQLEVECSFCGFKGTRVL